MQLLTASSLKTASTLATIAVATTPVAAPTPAVATPVVSTSYDSVLEDWLYTLRMCESGGNYQEDTGNGFYGAYQFTLATWGAWNTGYANPIDAPPSVQDATIIENTNASSGGLSTQNPGCFSQGNLSEFPPS
jgi:hypothetical protein